MQVVDDYADEAVSCSGPMSMSYFDEAVPGDECKKARFLTSTSSSIIYYDLCASIAGMHQSPIMSD